MTPSTHTLRKHLITAAVAFLVEVAVYSVTCFLPANKGIAILLPLLLPGTLLQFIIGGGMSMVDGVAPEWRTGLAFALGFLVNTGLAYGCCFLVTKVAKIIRLELQSH